MDDFERQVAAVAQEVLGDRQDLIARFSRDRELATAGLKLHLFAIRASGIVGDPMDRGSRARLVELLAGWRAEREAEEVSPEEALARARAKAGIAPPRARGNVIDGARVWEGHIRLAAGTRWVEAVKAPRWIAAALHPEPDDPEPWVTRFEKAPVDESGQVDDLASQPLEPDELEHVRGACGLPTDFLPMRYSHWLGYERAAQGALGPRWALRVVRRNPSLEVQIKREHAAAEHRKGLREAFNHGQIELRDPVTLRRADPRIHTFHDGLLAPLAAFAAYVGDLAISVETAEDYEAKVTERVRAERRAGGAAEGLSVERAEPAASADYAAIYSDETREWRERARARAAAWWLDCDRSTKPNRSMAASFVERWCRDNSVRGHAGTTPNADYLRKHVLDTKHWDPPPR